MVRVERTGLGGDFLITERLQGDTLISPATDLRSKLK
jgi:hypothetical protein